MARTHYPLGIEGAGSEASSVASSQSAPDSSSRIGKYVLGRVLGEGAFAKVRLATHMVTGHLVAMKIVYKHKIKDDYVRANLQREGRLLRRLHHPNIIRLYEIIETERVYCMVLEAAEGGELLDHIIAHDKLQEYEVRKYVRQLASAVAHMHNNGIVHRSVQLIRRTKQEESYLSALPWIPVAPHLPCSHHTSHFPCLYLPPRYLFIASVLHLSRAIRSSVL